MHIDGALPMLIIAMTFGRFLWDTVIGTSDNRTVKRHAVLNSCFSFLVSQGYVRCVIIYGCLIGTFMTVLIVLLVIPSSILLFKILHIGVIKFWRMWNKILLILTIPSATRTVEVFLIKKVVAQEMKKFHAFYGTRRLISMFIIAFHWSVSWGILCMLAHTVF
jgi:hypothetical protein